MVSSEAPRLGPSVVEVSATAERTPGVARASASAAAGRPGPVLVMASSPVRPRVPLLGDGVVDGGRAEQQGAAHRDGEHQRRAGRREASRGGARGSRRRGSRRRARAAPAAARAARRPRAPRSGPRKPTATTRKIAVISDVAAAVSGVLVVVETVNSGTAPASASSPPMIAPRPEQPRLDRGVGERERRRDARGAPSGGQDGEQRRDDPASRWRPRAAASRRGR